VGTVRRAAALVVGNEILSGKIADENVVVLARTLRRLGVLFERVVMVLDDRDTIAREIRALAGAHDVLFTSGGVGPTHDDVTIEGVADAFAVPVVRSPVMEQHLRDYYAERITESHLLMARVPEGARLVTTKEMPWPTVVMRNVWILPGVPQIFRMKMPAVVADLGQGEAYVSLALHSSWDEGMLKPALDRVVAAFPDVEIGSYPQWREPRYRTKVTFDGTDPTRVARAHEAMRATLPADALVPTDD
jgi:molybdenum cofactor synthesis domain-containing protein